jgi:fructokinase
MIVVCGEALIDMSPTSCEGGRGYVPRAAGSPLNVAVTLGRMRVPVAFFGRVSTDPFGRMLKARLKAGGVDPRYLREGPEPSTLAIVGIEDGREPEFVFYGEGTADRMLAPADLPDVPPADAAAIHFGSISLIREPGASTLEMLMRRESPRLVVTLDPNVRPGLIGDRAAYLTRLGGWLRLAHVVKVSRADLAWLHPGEAPEGVARRWLELGPSLVVVTLGADGSFGITRTVLVRTAGRPVRVVDTVGAGDAFMGGLLARLHDLRGFTAEALERLEPGTVGDLLRYGGATAALTCERSGADPPGRAEVERSVGQASW